MTIQDDHPLAHLQPQSVWQWFAEICAIPHPTFDEHRLGDYIVERAKAAGLAVDKDLKGNIRIQKPATQGMQDHAPVAIQAHFDMVAQKGLQSEHNFATDAIQTRVQDGWVWANDTTLGADNGIGLAMGLAVAFSEDIAHPPLTLILTSEEEIGMGGVQALSPDWLTMAYLINLDSEDAGAVFVGCAGGRNASFSKTLPLNDSLNVNAKNTEFAPLQVTISGLQGGHSGIDIHKGLGNANRLLARLLAQMLSAKVSTTDANLPNFCLQTWQGGMLRNVITREATAVIVGDIATLSTELQTQFAIIQAEYQVAEPNLRLELTTIKTDLTHNMALSFADTQHFLDLLLSIPNGVLRMSDSFAGVVETSISMGVVNLQSDKHDPKQAKFDILCLMRSLAQTPKDAVSDQLQSLARLAGVALTLGDDYPGWQPDPNSVMLAQSQQAFNRFYGKPPTVEVIHAGLECGILKGKAPHLDMISFGPTIRAAHSPKERVEIATVAQTWEILLDLLTHFPKKGES